MDRFWNLPPSFRYAVQNTPNPNIVKVYNGQGRGGETVHVEPFTRENLDIVQAMLKEVRLSENPVIKYMTNQAVDIERSGARSHVLGQILSKEEALHQHFELGPAAAEAQVNGMGNCDRVNALVYLELQRKFGARHPVMYHYTSDHEHNLVVVGDPRMEQYGKSFACNQPGVPGPRRGESDRERPSGKDRRGHCQHLRHQDG